MKGLLLRAGLRYFAQHRLQLVMSILGVAVGVAMVTGVDVATESARRAFRLSAESVSGRATHQVTGPDGTLDEDLYVRLRTESGLRTSAPAVEGFVTTPDGTFRLLGIDPLADSAPGQALSGFPPPAALIPGGDGIVVSDAVAARWGVALGETAVFAAAGKPYTLRVVGIVAPVEEGARQGWADLIVSDIGTAQRVLNLDGRISRIDLTTTDSVAAAAVAGLGASVRLERPEARTESLSQMTKAFETNLQALSYLALVVGMFLIFNIMSFSVVQRRAVFSRLRAAGTTRGLITASLLTEAALLGGVGTLLGIGMGVALGQGLVILVSRAINDLYFVVTVTEAGLEAGTVLKSLAVGMGATLLSAWIPARAAARVSAVSALRRSDSEAQFVRGLRRQRFLAMSSLLVGIAVLSMPTGVTGGYAGLLLLIAGFSLLAPTLTRAAVQALTWIPLPLTGRMALQGIRTQLSRTSVATIALSVSVAAAVGVGVMVDSFRHTVQEWLDMTLRADVYVQAPAIVMRQGGGALDPEAVSLMRSFPGVASSYGVRRVPVSTSAGTADLVVIEHAVGTQRTYRFAERQSMDPWDALDKGDVFVSEPFAFRFDVAAGDTLVMDTARGATATRIAAVYVDYGSDLGTIIMDRAVYRGLFDDDTYNGLALLLEEGVDPGAVSQELRAATAPLQSLIVRSNASLREASLEIFDRTFAITWVLQALALVVSVIGVISALSALQLERAWEFAVQRAIGLKQGTLSRVLLLQSAIMGGLAGVLALPLGLALAAGLVFVINRRSFGWTLNFEVDPFIVGQALVVSVVAASIGALVPIWSNSRINLARRLRARDA